MFSIVIPTYNRADKLKRALLSLKSQSLQEFEVIVCDDGSSDDTKSVALSFQNDLDIKYIYLENSGGPAKPRNFGIKKAQYDWICLLDSDDWWYKDKLNEMKIAIQNFSSEVFYHDFEVYSGNKYVPCGKFYTRRLNKNAYLELLVYGNGIAVSSAVIKKEIILELGGFDENLLTMEDYDLWLRLAKTGVKFTYISKYLGAYWINDNDHMSANASLMLKCKEKIYDKHINSLSSQDKLLFLQSFNLHLASLFLEKKDFIKSLLLTFSILSSPRSLRLFIKALKFLRHILKDIFKEMSAV